MVASKSQAREGRRQSRQQAITRLEIVRRAIGKLIHFSSSRLPALLGVFVVLWFVFEPNAKSFAQEAKQTGAINDDSRRQDSASLIRRLYANPSDHSIQKRLWNELKNQRLSDDQVRLVLNHAFNLVTQESTKHFRFLFDRRSAPEFVYIQPRKVALLEAGVVIEESDVDSTGNGVEVYPESEGSGPFAWGGSRDEFSKMKALGFRVYYEVTYAPEMKWLEGYESYLQYPAPVFDLAPLVRKAGPPAAVAPETIAPLVANPQNPSTIEPGIFKSVCCRNHCIVSSVNGFDYLSHAYSCATAARKRCSWTLRNREFFAGQLRRPRRPILRTRCQANFRR